MVISPLATVSIIRGPLLVEHQKNLGQEPGSSPGRLAASTPRRLWLRFLVSGLKESSLGFIGFRV